MAVPTYTTDLQTFDLAEDTGSWIEFTNMSGGGAPAEDDGDNEIQGLYMTSQTCNTTGLVSVGKVRAAVTVPAGSVFLVWHQLSSPGAMESYASGGLRLVVGTDADNWKAWAVGGKLVPPNPYGGWQNNPIDPSFTPYEYSYGTPPSGTSFAAVGSAVNLAASIFKGNPHQCDAIRYGRAEARFSGGETANYATFPGFATVNDYNDAGNGYNRWGLIQAVLGGFLWKGLITLGYGSLVDFRDSNRLIFIQDTRKVASGFNKIEIKQSGSRVDWTDITFKNASPSTTASKGMLEVIDDCDVNIDSCSFIDMSTFIFQATSTILTSTFRRCGQVTQGTGVFTDCLFANSTAAVALLSNDIEKITGCTFESAGTGHAVRYRPIGAGPFDVDWSGNQDSSYAGTDGSTGNETILIDPVTTDADITINVVGGSSTPTIMLAAGYTGTFLKVINPVLTKITVKDFDTNAVIENARVYLAPSDDTGDLNFEESVSIISSGTTATVTHSGHGLVTNDWIRIKGCTQPEYNICAQITYISSSSYSYTLKQATSSPATGSPTSTTVIFNDLTDENGEVTDQRSWGYDQPVVGRVRQTTILPYYKATPITETIDKGTGLSINVLLIKDS